jgi:hypothetical protein
VPFGTVPNRPKRGAGKGLQLIGGATLAGDARLRRKAEGSIPSVTTAPAVHEPAGERSMNHSAHWAFPGAGAKTKVETFW